MANRFNSTQFPYIKHLGREFKSGLYYKHIFLIDGWDNEEEQKFHRKRMREWYNTHTTFFNDEINIWNSDIDASDINREFFVDVYNSMSNGFEKSGIITYTSFPELAFLYTITVYSEEQLEAMDKDGIDHGKVEVRMVAVYTMKPRHNHYFPMSALCFLNLERDDNSWLQMAVTHIEDSIAYAEGIEYMKDSFRRAMCRVLTLEFGRLAGIVEEYSIERGKKEENGVTFPYENFTNLNLKYIYNININKDMYNVHEDEIVTTGNGFTLYKTESDYFVEHCPVDYVNYGKHQYGIMDASTWGLDKAFNPLSKDSDKYKELYERFKDDEPSFFGRMLMPVTDSNNCTMELHKVYVVRCFNNGTTYFVSDSKEALSTFCY